MRLFKRVFFSFAAVLIVLTSTFCIYVFGVQQVPVRMYTSIFWSPQENAKYEDKIVIIDMGSDDSFPMLWKSVGSFVENYVHANLFIIPYRKVTTPEIKSYKPDAVILTGFFQAMSSYKDEEMTGLFEFLRDTDIPVLGICGGLQFIAKAYGSKIKKLGFVEKGFVEVNILSDDPFFNNLDKSIKIYSWHGHQVDPIPDNFILIGTNDSCRIQIIKHQKKTIYGVQFHPEYASINNQHGVTLMKNFLDIADVTYE